MGHFGWFSVLIIAAVAVTACRGTTIAPVPSIDGDRRAFAPVARGSIIETVPAAGTLRYAREAELPFGETGTVQSVAVEVGQRVRAGEELAALDPETLRGEVLEAEEALATALRRAEAVRAVDTALLLSEAQEAVAQARVDLNRAETALQQTRVPFTYIDRVEAQERLAAAQVALTEAVAERAVIQDPSLSVEAAKVGAEVEAARANVEAAQAAVESARAAAEAAREPTPVRTVGPIDSFPDLEAAVASAEQEYRAVVRRAFGLAADPEATLPSPLELRTGGLPPTTTLLGSAALPQAVTHFFRGRGIEWPPGGGDKTTGVAAALILEEVETAWRTVTDARAALSTARLEAARQAAAIEAAAVQAAIEAAEAVAERARADVSEAEGALAEAQAALAAREAELANVNAPRPTEDVVLAEARVSLAEARVGEALQALRALESDPDPNDIALAEARVATAAATLVAALRERDRVETEGIDEQLSEAAAAVERAQVRLGVARLRLERTTLTAPFDGVIAEVRTGPGAAADIRSPAIVLIDPTRTTVEASVGQAEVVKMAEGQRALVSLESTLEVVDGVVESIALLPVERDGVTTYDVAISLDQSITGTASSLSGLSVQAHVVVGEVDDALFVPREAIYREDGRTLVRMLDAAGILRDRRVTLGKGNALWVQITSGAEEDDRVLLAELPSEDVPLAEALAPYASPSPRSAQAHDAT